MLKVKRLENFFQENQEVEKEEKTQNSFEIANFIIACQYKY
jgi:hypothetical protein